MKERPILFGASMVCAVLSGKKTQTRRIVKGLPVILNRETNALEVDTANMENGRFAKLCPCPYGQPGDRLWVRETWQRAGGNTGYWYAATDSEADDGVPPVSRWSPSIHMPRAASRILLEISGVRVERLQDISPDDCIAEGVWSTDDRALGRGHEAVAAYRALWEQIHGPGSWDANPWVWVVGFCRLQEGGAT